MTTRAAFLAAVLGFAAAACARSGPAGAPAGTASAAGPRVVLPSGAVVYVDLARTDAERAQGLMYRESLADGAGMLFLFEGLEVRPFWMKNCHFPIDIVHLTKDGAVADVLAGVPPCAADPCPTYPPAAPSDTVLEINAGVAAKNGVVRGAKLRYLDVPGR